MPRVDSRLVATIVLTLCTMSATAQEKPTRSPQPGSPQTCKGSRLTRNGDFRVLHLKGTWYEMGYAHGQLLSSEVRQNTTELWRDKIVPMLGADNAPTLRSMALALRSTLPKEIQEELQGLADGSGVPLEDLQAATLVGDVMVFQTSREVQHGGSNPVRPNCSSFAAFGKATKDGRLIYGHNFDWMKELGIHDRALCTAYEPSDGQRFCTLGWAGILIAVTGLNDSGITVGCIGATSVAERPDGLSMGLTVRKVLQEARDLSQAEAVVGGARRMCGFNYVLGDGRTPDARVFETNAEQIAVFRPNQRSPEDPRWMIHVEDALFREDTAMNPAVRDKQTCTKGKPEVPGLEPPDGSGAYENRYKVIAALLQKNHGTIDVKTGIRIMQAAAMPEANMQSFVCDATAKVFQVAVAKGNESAHKRRYIRFDFQKLFASAPPQQ